MMVERTQPHASEQVEVYACMLQILSAYFFSLQVFHYQKDAGNSCEQTGHVSEVVEVHSLMNHFFIAAIVLNIIVEYL